MGKTIVYVCDFPGCNKIRNQTNHWWQIDIRDGQLRLQPLVEGTNGDTKTYCSVGCVQRMVEKFLSDTTVDSKYKTAQ